jgi:GNAT superfamily N-acetyltransferase
MRVTIGELPLERWPEAGALAGRAFWTEAYMRVFADDPVRRFATLQDVYARMDVSSPDITRLAAFAGSHIVGVACIDRPGTCSFCSTDPDRTPDDEPGRILHAVDLVIRDLHRALPEHHANVGPIAVEPQMQGLGIGHQLVEAAWAAALAHGPETVALDCDPHLQTFYESHGFRPIGSGTDPWGFEIVALRRDPDPHE